MSLHTIVSNIVVMATDVGRCFGDAPLSGLLSSPRLVRWLPRDAIALLSTLMAL